MDELVDGDVVEQLRRTFRAHASSTRSDWSGLAAAASAVAGRPLRRRVDLVRDAIVSDVGSGFDLLNGVVDASLAEPGFRGWAIWPVTEAVAELAVGGAQGSGRGGEQTFEQGLELMRRLTSRLSAEFALRTFLLADPDRTVRVVQHWCDDDDEHVRRLASEGTRSYLPWARQVPALHARPDLTLPIVDGLYRDESEYVRRSVGNHVNDLSRRHPDVAVQVGSRWLTSPDGNTPALVRRAFRTLVKAGDERALAALGFGGTAAVTGPLLDRTTVQVGEDLEIRATVRNAGATRAQFAVDYVVHYRKARGPNAPKVFKIATLTLDPGESRELVKRRSFAPTSTRVLHPGPHTVELQVNGRRHGEARVELRAASSGERP
ncbi:DNA alkylation repair protein [Nocardioides sp. AX2bis]|uniref:DNA alkylation repair protein n=1 Tax=Nocardioides sp. AX2bis TaxID=2653157 RepID=UPI001357F423|nr:DNA alkylation repair protein [Nocardioides sp. AX2bis]